MRIMCQAQGYNYRQRKKGSCPYEITNKCKICLYNYVKWKGNEYCAIKPYNRRI